MTEKKQDRASIRAAISKADAQGDTETADRLRAVLKALDDVDATVTAALAAVIATM